MKDYKQKLISALDKLSPFWRAIQDGPSGTEKTEKLGRGPSGQNQELNQEVLVKVWTQYIHSLLRAKLYIKLPEIKDGDGFEPEESPRPLRQRDGKLVDPLIIVESRYAKMNPQWETAPQEWWFKFSVGVLVGPKNPDEFLSYDSEANLYRIFDVWEVNPTKGSKYLATR